MRKIILYTLLILLLLATLTLAYGFYNAKKIRSFAKNAGALEKKYDFDGELQEVEKYFQKVPSKDAQAIQDDAGNYTARLQGLVKKTDTAQKEVKGLGTPRVAKQVSSDLLDYYAKAGKQAADISALVTFMNQVFSVSTSFQQIGAGATLDDIKNTIAEAQKRADSVSADTLPQGLRADGVLLANSTKSFITSMQTVATERKEEASNLESAYQEFSKGEDQFSNSAQVYISNMEDLGPLRDKIDAELPGLGGIYFSLK